MSVKQEVGALKRGEDGPGEDVSEGVAGGMLN